MIESCYFSKNKSLNGGNSIYIENDHQNIESEVIVNSCTFCDYKENNENSFITAEMSSNIRITISSSNFLNLNTKNYIFSFSEDILSTNIDNCTISYNCSEIEGGGISIISNGKININSVFFNSTRLKAALKIESNEVNEKINIINCTFDSCLGSDLCIGLNYVCFGIEFMTQNFSFENNTIIESNFYIGIINCKNKFNLKMINDRFINNSCSSL